MEKYVAHSDHTRNEWKANVILRLLCKIKHVRTQWETVVRAQFDPPGKIDLCDSSVRRDKEGGLK